MQVRVVRVPCKYQEMEVYEVHSRSWRSLWLWRLENRVRGVVGGDAKANALAYAQLLANPEIIEVK